MFIIISQCTVQKEHKILIINTFRRDCTYILWDGKFVLTLRISASVDEQTSCEITKDLRLNKCCSENITTLIQNDIYFMTWQTVIYLKSAI